jgi:two-component system cell cycle sensor histidine kinase/response regulator CckA
VAKRISQDDILKSNAAEQTLSVRELPYHLLFVRNPHPMYVYDAESFAFLAVNEAAIKHYGYSTAEFLRMTIRDIHPAEDIPALLESASQEVAELEQRHRKKDGDLIDVEVTTNNFDWVGRLARLAVVTDITERRRMEKQLRQSEESHRRLVEQSPDPLLVHRQGTIIFANGACATFFGAASVDEFLGKQHLDLVHPDDREAVKQRIQKFSHDVRSVRRNETKYLRFDGTEAYVEVVAHSIIYHGEPAIHVIFRDISQRKRVEQELRQSEANLATAQRMAHLGSFEFDLTNLDDLDKTPVRWSDEVFRIFGYEPRQIEASRGTVFRAVHPDDQIRVRDVITKAIQDRSPYGVEYRLIRPDGTQRFVRAESNIVCDEKTRKPLRMVGTVQDVTESKHMEEMFRQTQKMEAVGQLAGGVAHDFNNLLMVIMGYADVLADRMGKADPLRKSAEEIKKAGQRAASLTRQLLAFSRQQVLEPHVLNLNFVVPDVEKMLGRLIGEHIALATVLAPKLGHIKADQGQIEQVIINLAVNARDAMPDGGKLTIETANVEVDEAYARQHGHISPGSFIMLTMTDTGIGMDSETQSHIFEPFFTTKERGKGTGLGLATVYGVVKQSGGFIWVYSESGYGTTFKILLPRIYERERTSGKSSNSDRSWLGSETILLVEDDASLRELILNSLNEQGYTVLEAANGRHALDIARQRHDKIDLLLTDVVMPGMSGPLVADELASVHPEVRVLYMSGYTEFAPGHDQISRQGRLLLQKPFTQQDLARKVREALEANCVRVPSPRD